MLKGIEGCRYMLALKSTQSAHNPSLSTGSLWQAPRAGGRFVAKGPPGVPLGEEPGDPLGDPPKVPGYAPGKDIA